MTIDMYDTREMTASLSQLYPPRTWIRDTLFSETEEHTSQYVDIDIEKGDRKIAAYVSPLHEGKKVDRKGFTTNTFKAPYTKNKMETNPQDYLKRRFGQTVYNNPGTAGNRAEEDLGKNLKYLSEMLDRLEELQASTAIQTGKVIARGEGIDAEIDYGFDPAQLPVLAGNAKWSDLTNSDPILNLSAWFQEIDDRSGHVPANCIFGRLAMQNFIRGTKTQNLLDNRRIKLGQIDPEKYRKNGVRYWGYLDEPGIDIWTYSAHYYDEPGKKLNKYIDDNKVIMWGEGARTKRHYGAIEDLENYAVVQRFAKSWITKDPSVRWVMVQSAPLVVIHQPDAFLCATVQ